MIAHHEQALVMTAMVPDRTRSRDLRLLAERMDVSQADEITQMEDWLSGRSDASPSEGHGDHEDHGGHDHGTMPGMLSEAELTDLESARGAAFERLFLQYMIRHHEGALVMVQQVLDAGGGQEPALFQLIQHVDADQRVEISRMRSMLAAM
jgi:uncharacterized protein (DUF305 family)